MTPTEQAKTMVRRVAEAIALADLDDETRSVVNIDAHMEYVGAHYEELARAAIEAMPEVDDSFFARVADLAHDGRFSVSGETYPVFRNFMRAMTAAALSEDAAR